MKAWYLLYCKRGQLNRAQQHLNLQHVESFYPVIQQQKLYKGRRVSACEPPFPNYLFINLDPDVEHTTTISATRGVSHFIRFGNQPALVPAAIITSLQTPLDIQSVAPALPVTGDTVTLTTAPFAGLQAIYNEPDGETRSILLINLLNKTVKHSFANNDFFKQ
jgi:transcriptional antiterminator RfaH